MRAIISGSERVTVAVVLAICAFIGMLGWAEYSNWKGQVARAEMSMQQTAEAIGQHVDDVFEMAGLPLASLIAEIADEPDAQVVPRKIKSMIMRQMKSSSTLNSLSYIDASGTIVATSAEKVPPGANYSERDYFKLHSQSRLPLPVFGKPLKSSLIGEWVLPITQRVQRSDGTFAGVAVATVRVNHFVNFFRHFDVGNDGIFLVAGGNGTIMARGPVNESMLGTNISSNDLFSTHLKTRPSGAYHYRSPVDGIVRIGGFYQSARTGIVVLAAVSERESFLKWVNGAQDRWIYAAILCAIAIAAATRWRHQIRLRKEADAVSAAREAEFRLLAESSSDLITRFNEDGVREYVSPSSLQILGVAPEELIGKSVFGTMDEDGNRLARQAADRLQNGSLHEKLLTRYVKPNGEEIWLDTALSKLPATKGVKAARVVAIIRDVTRHKLMQDALDALANTDELTQLANRRSFNLRFEEMVKSARRSGSPLTLLMIDADHFKHFNDTYGHAAGDACLQRIAAVVRECVNRPSDLAARYGGEEMAVLLADTDSNGARIVAEKIRFKVSQLGIPHERNLPAGHATVSIGAATMPARAPKELTEEIFFEQADAALYRAKSAGRNQVVNAEQLNTNTLGGA